MSKKRLLWISIVFAALWISACSQVLAAERPRPAQITPIAVYPPSAGVVYQAELELLTSDVDQAASQASRWTYELAGAVESSTSWYVQQQKFIRLELSVPISNYERLRASLLTLGQVVRETSSGQPIFPPQPGGYPDSRITLQLDPAAFPPPLQQVTGWRPLQTLQRAWQVFLRIFGFLADLLIWALVVAGPFILIGAVIWRFIRRKAKPERPDPPTV